MVDELPIRPHPTGFPGAFPSPHAAAHGRQRPPSPAAKIVPSNRPVALADSTPRGRPGPDRSAHRAPAHASRRGSAACEGCPALPAAQHADARRRIPPSSSCLRERTRRSISPSPACRPLQPSSTGRTRTPCRSTSAPPGGLRHGSGVSSPTSSRPAFFGASPDLLARSARGVWVARTRRSPFWLRPISVALPRSSIP